jgi:outer membrane protein insertion porin family
MNIVRYLRMTCLTIFVMALSVSVMPAQPGATPFGPPPVENLPPGNALPNMNALPNAAGLGTPAENGAIRPLVVDVIIRGSNNEDRVRNFIRTKKEYEYDPALLQSDVRRLITSNQFQHVKTYTRNVAEGVVVIFDVTDRPRINYVVFHGNRGFTDKKLLKTVGLKQGEPLNSYDVEEGRRQLEELYHSKGYPKAQIGILEGDKPTDQGVVYVVSEGYLQRISEVQFAGNTFVSGGVLKTKIESKPGFLWLFFNGKLNREKLDSDVEKLTAYYHDFGYFRARVGREISFDDSGKWATITFIIDEGQRYNVRNISIVGNEKFHADPILEAMKVQPNMPFNRGQMQRDLTLLKDLYGSQGYIFTDIQANPRFLEEPGQIDLVYKIQEGEPFRVGTINVHIAGEFPHTRRNVVLNRLSLQPGDLIDIRQVRDSERRLKFSQLFETEQTGGEPPRIVIRPPELSDTALAANEAGSGVRGQNPAANIQRLPAPTYDLDVYVNTLKPTKHEQALPDEAFAPVTDTFTRLPPVTE